MTSRTTPRFCLGRCGVRRLRVLRLRLLMVFLGKRGWFRCYACHFGAIRSVAVWLRLVNAVGFVTRLRVGRWLVVGVEYAFQTKRIWGAVTQAALREPGLS